MARTSTLDHLHILFLERKACCAFKGHSYFVLPYHSSENMQILASTSSFTLEIFGKGSVRRPHAWRAWSVAPFSGGPVESDS